MQWQRGVTTPIDHQPDQPDQPLIRGFGADPAVAAVMRRRQQESRRQIALLRDERHEARRRAVVQSVRSRHVVNAGPRPSLIGRLLGR
jgi:hypothetical protein